MTKIGFAADHAGFELKGELIKYLTTKGMECVDFGTNSAESCDYADYAHPLAYAVEKGEVNFGIAICGSGNGISMVVNKHAGIRASLCWNAEIAGLGRAHNNANICSLPARYITTNEAKEIIDTFMNTDFEGGRHQKRIEKIPLQ